MNKELNSKNIIIIALTVIGFLIMCSLWLIIFSAGSTGNNTFEEIEKQRKIEEQQEQQQIEQEKKKLEELNNQLSNNTTNKVNEKDYYSVGETYEGAMKITFLNYDNNFTDFKNVDDMKSTDRMVRAEFEIENLNAQSLRYVSSGDFRCFADSYAVNKKALYESNGIYDSNFGEDLSIGRKIKGAIYFVVPNSANEIIIEYETYENAQKKDIKFKAE